MPHDALLQATAGSVHTTVELWKVAATTDSPNRQR